MPLGSSSAAPVIKPGPSCFNRGSRAAGLTAAAETAASCRSFAVMAAVGERRAVRRCGSVGENPDNCHADERLTKKQPGCFQKPDERAITHRVRGLGRSV